MERSDQQFYETAWTEWDDMKTYGAASRHVRRLIFMMLKGLTFESVLDVGCGVGTLLAEFRKIYPAAALAGTEYAASGLEVARQRLPDGIFNALDLASAPLPAQSDLVLCIDVLEHIPADVAAMKNLRTMTKKYLLAVVPLGPLFEVERLRVGHVHGYSRAEFNGKLEQAGFRVIKEIQWGFPFYNIYRRVLHQMPESTVSGRYGFKKRFVSFMFYLLLFINLPFWGERHFVLCEPQGR